MVTITVTLLAHRTNTKTNTISIFVQRHFIYVRTSPALLAYSVSDASLVDVCRSCTSETVVRAVIYSNDGYIKRTQIKRDIEERMGHTTCLYIVFTCGLILCCAACCFPCFQKVNPKLDEMSLSQQVQDLHPDPTTNAYSFTVIVTTTINETKIGQ